MPRRTRARGSLPICLMTWSMNEDPDEDMRTLRPDEDMGTLMVAATVAGMIIQSKAKQCRGGCRTDLFKLRVGWLGIMTAADTPSKFVATAIGFTVDHWLPPVSESHYNPIQTCKPAVMNGNNLSAYFRRSSNRLPFGACTRYKDLIVSNLAAV